MKAYQEGPQNGLQNASLAYSNSFNIFERVLQFQPWKIFGEASDLQTCTAGMWSLLCTPRGRIKGPWYSSSLQRKRTWSEGQKPKGWFVVWLSAAPRGCRNQINLWKAVKVFLAWVSLSKWNREIEFLWKASLSLSLSVPGALCNLDLVRTACLYLELGTTAFPFSFHGELFMLPKA